MRIKGGDGGCEQGIGEAGRKARTARADAQASELAPIIAELRQAGVTSLRAIASERLTEKELSDLSGL